MTTETCGCTALHTAVVKQIISGDTIVIREKVFTAERTPLEYTLILSNVTARKLAGNAGESHEPFAWEAREYLRNKLLGKEVFYIPLDQKVGDSNDRKYGIVFYPTKDDNVTEELVSRGYVSVLDQKKKSPNKKKLIELEIRAKEKGVGIWGKEGLPRTVKVITENTDALVPTYEKKPVKAIVESVKDASTLKVLLLEDFVMIDTFMISGIQTDNDEFKDEAKFLVKEKILQHDVEVIIESANKSRTAVIGSVIHPKGNIAELLLKEGFATVDSTTMATVTNVDKKLKAAEKHAKEHRVRRWKGFQKPGDAEVCK